MFTERIDGQERLRRVSKLIHADDPASAFVGDVHVQIKRMLQL